jgi:twitching motility protein PilT
MSAEVTSEALDLVIKALIAGASDVYVRGTRVWLRLPDGVLPATELEGVTAAHATALARLLNDADFIPSEARQAFTLKREVNFAIAVPSRDPTATIRLRVHGFYSQGEVSYAIRIIPVTPDSLVSLGFDEFLEHRILNAKSGLFLVTGPTGAGKSTTLAAILQRLASSRPLHIITLEDPIEYVIHPLKSLVHQRELGTDFHTFPDGARSVLRESPDVVMVGEVRDLDTLRWTLSLAEAGFLVFATYHTRSPRETVERILGSFPEAEQNQTRMRLTSVLIGVLSQFLLPTVQAASRATKPRAVAYEYMFATDSVRTIIRENKTHLIPNELAKNEVGVRFEDTLARLVRTGIVSKQLAEGVAPDRTLFNQKLVL